MLKEVKDYLEKYRMIETGDTVVIGVSGGADSVCLLLLLHEYHSMKDFRIAVVHMNHLIRANAKEDADYVKKLCDKLQIPFYLFEKDIEGMAKEKGISTEEAGRIARYEAFNEVLTALGGKGKIAVAHNRSDCAETVLFNLFRGSGLTGLSGILPVRDNIIRPVLCLSREQIEDYLMKQKVSWCIDPTNNENTYTRNKIRNTIIPYAEKEICNQSIEHIARTAGEMAEIREYFEKQTKLVVEKIVTIGQEGICIYVPDFLALENIMQKQVLLYCMDILTSGRKDIGMKHILDIQKLFEKEGSKQVDLPYHLEAVKQYDKVLIKRKRDIKEEAFYKEVKVPESIVLPNGQIMEFTLISKQKDINIPQKTYTKWFDYDKIINCLVLRNRKIGDFLTINESMSKKKLKDYLIQEKVPKDERNNLLLLTDGSHIIWVLGLRISEYYKVTKETKRILQVVIK